VTGSNTEEKQILIYISKRNDRQNVVILLSNLCIMAYVQMTSASDWLQHVCSTN